MKNSSKPPQNLPRDLVSITHHALRALAHPHSPLDLAALQSTLPTLFADASLSVRAVLERALDHLAARAPDDAAFLRARFWDRCTIQQLAFAQHRSVSNVYAHQAEAIRALAQALWELEQNDAAARQDAHTTRRRNLPPATWTRLFGVDASLARVRAWLRDPQGPALISIEGLGGIGKTSLAHAVAQTTLDDWHDLAWIVVAHRPYQRWVDDDATALDPECVLEQIAWQLGWEEIARLPPRARRAALQQQLARAAYLIVIDDLEPAHQPEKLIEHLVPLLQPTRIILTTRQRLTDLPLGAHLPLRELARVPAYELVRDEMARRHLRAPSDDWLARVYDLVGGNPLALKLVAGQAASVPLEHIVENLRAARGAPAEQLWGVIYQQSWNLLSIDARQTLGALTTFSPRGATYAELGIATELRAPRLDAALAQLVAHSLLFFDGTRYTMHRLTHTFLLQEQNGVPSQVLHF
jgi:LuxR family glucitol operon transcriptional activator